MKQFSAADLRWYLEQDPQKAADAVCTAIDVVRNRPAYRERKKQFLMYASLYGNTPLLGFGLNHYTLSAGGNRISLNVTQNAIDALVSKVTKNRPRPTFTTVEGDYEMRERAENMGRFVSGQFYQTDFYDNAPGSVLDSCIYGTGLVKTFESDGDVCIDRTFPWELIVDDREALYGFPRGIMQRKYYDRQVLRELYAPESRTDDEAERIRQAIEKGGTDSDDTDFDYDRSCDQILVYEAWHLKSSKTSTDGKHIICIRDACLKYEAYDEPDFPFTPLRPMRAPMGFWGIGICEKLSGIQAEINRIVRNIQAAMHLIAKPHWMVENSAKVNTNALNNDIATIIRYTGAAPQVYTPQAMSPETYSHLQFLYRTAYEITGISQLSAQSQKPPGLDSGAALRTFQDVESERFTDFVRSYETMVKNVSEKVVRCAKKIAKGKRNYSANAIDKGGLLRISFKDADLDADNYAIRIFPTSMLPETPAGKLSFVSEMQKAQMVSADDAFELIDWPDTDKFAKRRLAPRRIIERDVAAMLKGAKRQPKPTYPLQYALKFVNEALAEAELDERPESVLQLLRDYAADTNDMLNPPPPEPQDVPPPPGPGQDMGGDGMLPSDTLPPPPGMPAGPMGMQ